MPRTVPDMTMTTPRPQKKRAGKPRDEAKREEIRQAWASGKFTSHEALAKHVGSARRMVAEVLGKPIGKHPRGVRMVIPAELAAWADTQGGVVAVLERARGAVGSPAANFLPPAKPPVRDRWP